MAHLGGIQRLIHFLLPAIAIFTLRSPVSIPIGLYGAGLRGLLHSVVQHGGRL